MGTHRPAFLITLLELSVLWVSSSRSMSAAESAKPEFRDGEAQIVAAFKRAEDWVRQDLWVETEFDSDGDGKRDRMFTDVTRPVQTETAGLKVAVIYLKDPYGEGLSSVFQETYKTTMGPMMEPSLAVAFPFDASTDKMTLAASVAAEAPGAVLIISVQAVDAIAIMKELAKTSIAQAMPMPPFFFTDGSKDNSKLLDATLPPEVIAMIQGSKGTAPARPSGPNYELFKTNLFTEFKLDASSFAFLAQAYDATYVGAYGIILAAKNGPDYDGIQVAAGLTHLSKGKLTNVAPTTWQTAKGELIDVGQLNVEGTSGHLDFDPKTGEAPAPIEVWGLSADKKSFKTIKTIDP